MIMVAVPIYVSIPLGVISASVMMDINLWIQILWIVQVCKSKLIYFIILYCNMQTLMNAIPTMVVVNKNALTLMGAFNALAILVTLVAYSVQVWIVAAFKTLSIL